MNQALLQYPEFIVALVLGAICLLVPQSREVVADPQEKTASTLGVFAYSLSSLLPQTYQQWLTNNQIRAGWRGRNAVCRFYSWKLYPAIVSGILALWLPLLAVLLVSIFLFFIADLWLVVSVNRRRREIAESLPQALDLLLLCVDAGLGLDAALQRIANERTVLAGALNDELNRLGKDILLGMNRAQAYSDLYERTGVDELRSLGAALSQSQKLGLSVSTILRAQSEFMRNRQQRKAEERAAKLPVWMAFPLWFCIMPALMLILIGPSLLLFIHQTTPLPHGLWH
ncbi:MAG: type II secretion system F family protein [Candidatus Obscuribacterales bacterium]|nr:type II secretion system F family protein [Candidatus Obscuribacterales bacterium]